MNARSIFCSRAVWMSCSHFVHRDCRPYCLCNFYGSNENVTHPLSQQSHPNAPLCSPSPPGPLPALHMPLARRWLVKALTLIGFVEKRALNRAATCTWDEHKIWRADAGPYAVNVTGISSHARQLCGCDSQASRDEEEERHLRKTRKTQYTTL